VAWAFAASGDIVINELHYNPDVKTEPVEFVELYNAGAAPVNLQGWTLSAGAGLRFTFPATNVAAGGYAVVAQNPAALQAKYAVTGALGPFNTNLASALSKYGDRVELRTDSGALHDEVEYRLGFPWPTVGDPPGYSIELIHPSLDNNLGGSWRSSQVPSGTATGRSFINDHSTWRYFKGTSEASTPVTAWRERAFDDSTWLSGVAPIGYGETFITNSGTVLSDMASNYVSVYFRYQFVVTNSIAELNSLILEAQYDDGFKAWLNGVPLASINMPTNEFVAFNELASSSFESAAFVNVATVAPGQYLMPGTNILAVQAHNQSLAGSSDFFLDLRLRGTIGSGVTRGPTPGRLNSIYANVAPPQIRQVDHSPNQPTSGQAVRISAKVTDPDGVGAVTLQYQVVLPGSYIELTDVAYTNAANWISLPMTDDGAGGDLAAGDEVYSAMIPAATQVHRRLIRYRIIASDTIGQSVRVPYADDPQPNFAYFVYNGIPGWRGAVQPGAAGQNGVVQNYSSNVMGRLPVYHLIARSNTVANATWFSRYPGDLYQWAGTLVYDGKVYDHIHYRARGGVWRYSMCKNMWKFDMNRGHDFEPRDNWGRRFGTTWTKLNLGASIQQGDFNHRGEQGMFESVGFRMFQLAGVAAPHSTFVTFRVIDEADEAAAGSQFEGDFWGVYLAIEQENSRFLEEHGLPDGNLYKMEAGTGELNNLGAAGPTDKSDLNAFLNTYNSATNANLPDSWWRTNLNLPKYYGYQLAVQSIHHYDIADGKNYFYFRDPVKRQWEVCTWDLDLTWADNMYRAGQQGGDEPFKSRLLSNFANPGSRPALGTEFRNRVREWRDLFWNSDQAFAIIDEYAALLRGPTNGPTILDADRSMWDYNPKMLSGTYSDNPSSKAGQGRYYQFPNEPTVPKSFEGTIQLMKNYVGYRSTNSAFSFDVIAAEAARPVRPTLTYTGPSGYPINRLTFRSSSYNGTAAFASMRWRVGEITDPTSPNYDPGEPRKYELETVWDSGPISVFNPDITIPANVLRVGSRYRVRVLHTDVNGRNSNWSLPHEFTCGDNENQADLLNYLRLTELMFNPPPGGFEYVELYNASPVTTLDLSGVRFTQGIEYTCLPGTLLPPGGFLLVIGTTNVAAFRAYYGLDESVAILSAFSGSLNNAGEQLVLRTSAGGTDIVNLSYGDGRGWPPSADGSGHSLVLLDSALTSQGSGAGDYSGNWRASTYLRGSPGRFDAPPPPGPLLNEIVAHTDLFNEFDSNDWIELYNPSATPLTLGAGWYLSDDGSARTNLMKWQIPPGTILPARGFVTFDEATGFHFPTNTGFGLSKSGEQLFLSYLPGSNEDRVVDAVSFKAQENDWSLGRYPDGGPFWYALTPRTRNTNNVPPPARIVLSELLYHPPDTLLGTNLVDNSQDEFIEIHSPFPPGTVTPMTNAAGTWRLTGGVDFVFPAAMTIQGGEHLLIVNFDPSTNTARTTAFKSLYGITDPATRIFGPYGGKLGNSSDRVALERPQSGDLPGEPPAWVVVDEVIYSDQSPWPCGSDGSGNSLQRLDLLAAGNDPLNWTAAAPTAGRPRANVPPGIPAITAPPLDRVVATNANVTFAVSVCGTPPFTYRWLFNGQPISDATNAVLNLQNVAPSAAGEYRVVVANAAGSVTSSPAMLNVQFPPVIVTNPESSTVVREQDATFSVTAGGTPPFSYQWRFNGATLPGATNSILRLTGVQPSQGGSYTVVVQNTAGAVASSPATLTVLIPATITSPPTNRTQTVTINTNGYVFNPTNVTFNVAAVGIGPLRYQWRFNGADLPGANQTTLTVSNVTPAEEGTYTIVVNDDIGPTSASATLTVMVPPVFVLRPVPQAVVQGGQVTFSAQVLGHPLPFTNEWRKISVPIVTNIVNGYVSFLTLSNVQPAAAGNYNVVVRNRAFPSGIFSGQIPLSVLTDSDGDGLPDAWEALYFGGTNSAERSIDSDSDGMSNGAEFIAGTDPLDPTSYLRVEQLDANGANNSMRIQFLAVSNRTYTVQASDRVSGGVWTNFAEVPASSINRPVLLYDLAPPAGPRYYRLATPRVP
jgi:hypothetical protein